MYWERVKNVSNAEESLLTFVNFPWHIYKNGQFSCRHRRLSDFAGHECQPHTAGRVRQLACPLPLLQLGSIEYIKHLRFGKNQAGTTQYRLTTTCKEGKELL